MMMNNFISAGIPSSHQNKDVGAVTIDHNHLHKDAGAETSAMANKLAIRRQKNTKQKKRQRVCAHYREQIRNLGIVRKSIKIYEGGKYDGRFISVFQVSKIGKIRVYGDKKKVIHGAIVIGADGYYYPIEEGRIKIKVPVIVGNRDMPGTQETGLILFEGMEERCAFTKYFSDNKGVWLEESKLILVSALTQQRQRKKPNRDLGAHPEREKYLNELGPVGFTITSAKALQSMYWFFLSNPYAGELSYSQPYYVINGHILEGRYQQAFQIMLKDYNKWTRFDQLNPERFVREGEDGLIIEPVNDPSHPMHIPNVSATYNPRIHPGDRKQMEWHQTCLQYNVFHIGLNWEVMTDRRVGLVPELAGVGCTQSFLDVVEAAVAAKCVERVVSPRCMPVCAEEGCKTNAHESGGGFCSRHSLRPKRLCVGCKKTIARRNGLCHKCGKHVKEKPKCIECKVRESRAVNARCLHCINRKGLRCTGCGLHNARCQGRLCVNCYESSGKVRRKCSSCRVKLPRKKGLCQKCYDLKYAKVDEPQQK